MHSQKLALPRWHNCQLFPSGKAIYFSQDGWVMLWDNERGFLRVKYLPKIFQWGISSGCTAAIESEGSIRVAVQSLMMGLLWFDIEVNDSKCMLLFRRANDH
jgi:hypothetical protein